MLAVDLSRASLTFAKRKAQKLYVENIRFAQADTTRLDVLDERYDVIECAGVLLHMAEPEAGPKVFIGFLKPGGYVDIGLYSKLTCQHVQYFREAVAEKGFNSILEGMREFRAWVRSMDTPLKRQ